MHKNVVDDLTDTVAQCSCCIQVPHLQRLHDFLSRFRNPRTAVHFTDRHETPRRVKTLEALWQRSTESFKEIHSLEILCHQN